MGHPDCRRCGGSGLYLMSADAHRSEGIVPCGCPEHFGKGRPKPPETQSARRDRLRANLAGPGRVIGISCKQVLVSEGKPTPRTCAVCDLGPCSLQRASALQEPIQNWVQALLSGPIDQSRVNWRVYVRAAEVAELVDELRSGPVHTEKLRRLAELVISEIK